MAEGVAIAAPLVSAPQVGVWDQWCVLSSQPYSKEGADGSGIGAYYVLGNMTGSSAGAAYAALVAAAIPSLDTSKLTSGTLGTTRGGTGLSSFTANRLLYSSSTSAVGQLGCSDGQVVTWASGVPACGSASSFDPASPGAIGGTTPNTGAFTALTASTSLLTPLLDRATSGTLTIGGTSTTTILRSTGVPIATIDVNGLTIAGGGSIFGSAGGGGLSLGSWTGGTGLPTGPVQWSGAANQNMLLTAQGTGALGYARIGHTTGGYLKASNNLLELTGLSVTTITSSGVTEAMGSGWNVTASGQSSIATTGSNKLFILDATGGVQIYKSSSTLLIDFGATGPAAVTVATGVTFTVTDSRVSLGDAAVSQATNINTGVTINAASGVITTQTATTAALTAESGFTVTNSACNSASSVQARIAAYSGTLFTNGQPDVYVSSVSNGSFVLKVINRDATNALNGTMKIHFACV